MKKEDILAALQDVPQQDRGQKLLELLVMCEDFLEEEDLRASALAIACSEKASLATMERAIRTAKPDLDAAKKLIGTPFLLQEEERVRLALGQIVLSGTKQAREWAARHPLCPLEYRVASAMH